MSYDLFLSNSGNEMVKWTHFFPIYERHLSKFRNESVRLLEIGILGGGSLQYWKKWLGPRCQILGVDINETCKGYVEPQVSVEVGDQSDPEFLERITQQYGPFDIIIDDGGHYQPHVRSSFDFLYPRLTERGIYIVEDVEHSYYRSQGGGLRGDGGFIEHAKAVCDFINGQAWRSGRGDLVGQDIYVKKTMSVSFYSSMIVFERGFYATPHLHWQQTGKTGHRYNDNLNRPPYLDE